MNVLELNILDYGSTGKIMMQIAQKARFAGFNVFTASNMETTPSKKLCHRNDRNHFYFNSYIPFAIHYKIGGYLGLNGLFSFIPTLRLIFFMKKIHVDLLHIHNLHYFCINLPLFFWFVKKSNIPIIWTLHDCWTFTGRCPYFDLVKCNKWKSGCHDCPYPTNLYPQTHLDMSRGLWKLKKKLFTGLANCILITPSLWLSKLVEQSFLKDYPIKVIHNGIDLSLFKPTKSDFRELYGLVGKKVVLGVAFGWGTRKGLDVFIELARRFPDNYRIVLVGTDDNVDKLLPTNIVSIHRTQNQRELAEIYTTADVLANPTREENYPTVNMESIACGTPVVTFRTGGSPEISDETCGSVVDCDDIDAMEKEIRRICEEKPYSVEACLKRARAFDMNSCFEEYVNLFNEIHHL